MNAVFLKRWLEQGEPGRKSWQGFYAGPGPLFTNPASSPVMNTTKNERPHGGL